MLWVLLRNRIVKEALFVLHKFVYPLPTYPCPCVPSRSLDKGDHIGYSLGMNCFRHAMGAERRRLDTNDILEREEEEEDSADGWGDGGVDCELLVAGSYLHAHRVILARRSPVLRDMIAQVRLHSKRESRQSVLVTQDQSVTLAWTLIPFLYHSPDTDCDLISSPTIIPNRGCSS